MCSVNARELSQACSGAKSPSPIQQRWARAGALQTMPSEKWSSQISTNLLRTCTLLIIWPNMGGFQEGREKHFVHRQHTANFLSTPKCDDKSSANGSEIFFILQANFIPRNHRCFLWNVHCQQQEQNECDATIQPTQVWRAGRKKTIGLLEGHIKDALL